MEASISGSIDDDFAPEPRGRCYTWPMQQFVYEPPGTNLNDSNTSVCREQTVGQLLQATPSSSNMGSHLMPLGGIPMGAGAPGMQAPAKKKRCRKKPADQLAQKKPNPWGEESYSDIIAKALESAPEGRLKLNEIYQWFSDNIPYFRERSSQEEAAGWKNSIRHNLSLHSRFMRIQNEGAGKSSWWVINPDAKPGRNPRRQRASTIDSTTKPALERKSKGARKRLKEIGRLGGMPASGVSSLAGSQASVMSHDIYGDEDSLQPSFDPFRPRTQSNLSVPGSSARVSPSMDHQTFDDFEFPLWVENSVPIPSDILDRTDQMRIDNRTMMNGSVKQEVKPQPMPPKPVENQPPTYQDLNSVRGPSQLQNPLLRSHHVSSKFPQQNIPPYQSYNWIPPSQPIPNQQSCAAQQSVSVGNSLPIDLENLTLPDQPLMEMDVESLLRHELAQTRDHQIHFDI
ncbi:unnamed protein product [Auanema sp. JU1783]|nr:unnamed protein product [Auanema sp. JU1783]